MESMEIYCKIDTHISKSGQSGLGMDLFYSQAFRVCLRRIQDLLATPKIEGLSKTYPESRSGTKAVR